MNSERIEEIQKQCACPESQSVFTALHQVWNEVGQEYQAEIRQLEARVARLEKGLDYAGVKLIDHKDRRAYEYVDSILCEEPPQSLHAIKHALTDDLTIDRPAKIGHMKFGKGVSWRLVVECAQRQFAQADKG